MKLTSWRESRRWSHYLSCKQCCCFFFSLWTVCSKIVFFVLKPQCFEGELLRAIHSWRKQSEERGHVLLMFLLHCRASRAHQAPLTLSVISDHSFCPAAIPLAAGEVCMTPEGHPGQRTLHEGETAAQRGHNDGHVKKEKRREKYRLSPKKLHHEAKTISKEHKSLEYIQRMTRFYRDFLFPKK